MSSAEREPADAGLDVLLVVSSDPLYDSRSSKYLSSLLEAGFRVKLVGISSDGTTAANDNLVRIPTTHRTGKRFFLQFYRRTFPEMRKFSPKIIIAGDLFSLLPALMNKRRNLRRNSSPRLIYDSKELYKELPSLKLKRSSYLFWDFVEKVAVRYVDEVITVNESIADILEAKWHLPTTVIMNVPDVARQVSIGERSLDKVTLAFSGGLQSGRGLHNLIRLLTLLPDKYELRFVGDGSLRTELEKLAASLNLSSRVHFIGRVKNTEVIDELSKATIGIYLMENSGLCHYLALPNKLFQFINARLPVIVPTFPEMENIVSKFEIGAAVDPTDIKAAASKVLELTSDQEHYSQLVRNCEKAAGILNWQLEKEKFVELIRRSI
jgi:glycosyltransferase involved in cell wall biosynthesis